MSRSDQGMAMPLRVLVSPRNRIFRDGGDGLPTASQTGNEIQEPLCFRLEGRLPINLREFLAQELGHSLCIERDRILTVSMGEGDAAMRVLARAIRRFSFNRAHEPWVECGVSRLRLKSELMRFSSRGLPFRLCLKCRTIDGGIDPSTLHAFQSCLPVTLNQRLKRTGPALAEAVANLVPCGLYEVIERFRVQRTGAGLAHYDLDCYTTSREVVFTWRPLPSV